MSLPLRDVSNLSAFSWGSKSKKNKRTSHSSTKDDLAPQHPEIRSTPPLPSLQKPAPRSESYGRISPKSTQPTGSGTLVGSEDQPRPRAEGPLSEGEDGGRQTRSAGAVLEARSAGNVHISGGARDTDGLYSPRSNSNLYMRRSSSRLRHKDSLGDLAASAAMPEIKPLSVQIPRKDGSLPTPPGENDDHGAHGSVPSMKDEGGLLKRKPTPRAPAPPPKNPLRYTPRSVANFRAREPPCEVVGMVRKDDPVDNASPMPRNWETKHDRAICASLLTCNSTDTVQ